MGHQKDALSVNMKKLDRLASRETYTIRAKSINLRSPGLVVIGGDSWIKGSGFESRRYILDDATFLKKINF